MDFGVIGDLEPWEQSDGCIHLLRELSTMKKDNTGAKEQAMELVVSLLEPLSDLCLVDHFKNQSNMRENIFWTLACMIQTEALGKKKFRPWVPLFIEPAFRCARNRQ